MKNQDAKHCVFSAKVFSYDIYTYLFVKWNISSKIYTKPVLMIFFLEEDWVATKKGWEEDLLVIVDGLNIFTFITANWLFKWVRTLKISTQLPAWFPGFSDRAPLTGKTIPKTELPRKCQTDLLKQRSWVKHTQLLCLTGSPVGWSSFISSGCTDFQCSWPPDGFMQAGITP